MWSLFLKPINSIYSLYRRSLLVFKDVVYANYLRVKIIYPGINPDERDWNSRTKLHHAAIKGYVRALRVLINQGKGDKNVVDAGGDTLLHQAAFEGQTEVVRVLRNEFQANVNVVNKTQSTPLHAAADCDHAETVRLLISFGANVRAVYQDNATALHFAAQYAKEETISLLINSQAEVNAADNRGDTPLHYAARTDNVRAASVLIVQGNAHLTIANNHDETPIIMAFERGHHAMVRLLQQHGAQLPAHLRPEQLAGAAINPNQSVHTVSVHKSVSESAKALTQRYKHAKVKEAREKLISWVTDLKDEDIKTKAAQRCIAILQKSEFKDERSKVSMQGALGLVWLGIHDPNAQAKEKLLLNEKDFIARRQHLIKMLYEIGRGYNIDLSGKDNQENDRKSCESGGFNNLINTLAGGHDDVKFIFVTGAVIAAKAQALLKEQFLKLNEAQRKSFAVDWSKDSGPPEALIKMLKPIVEKALHAQFDEFKTLVPDYNHEIAGALEVLESMPPPHNLAEVLNVKKNEQDSLVEKVLTDNPDPIILGKESQSSGESPISTPASLKIPERLSR